MNTDNTALLLITLTDSIRELGSDGVVAILRNARQGYLDETVDKVVKEIANYHKLSAEDMVSLKNHSHKRKIALGFCVYYLHNQGYSFGTMKKVFNRSRSRLSRLNTMIEEMIDNGDKYVIETKKELDKIIKL